ncbi:MAG: LAGLIDADG family homing endonuclease, partial [Isosphaeraceae bacterium]
MVVPRVFSTEGISPFDQVDWDLRTAEIKDERGRAIFQQVDCEVPQGWSQLATNVVASKYFYGDVASGNGSPGEGKREYSVRQLVDRVTRTIADWGRDDGYFATADDAERFYNELTALCLNQYGSFNSPVWFNVGLFHRYGIAGPANNWRWDEETRNVVQATSAYQTPQASACFIQSVSDDMEGIMRLAHSEAMLFKFGSGTGTDLSTLRSSREKLSGGGKPSGPVSFMRVYDAIASVVKSGGKTRRAAKMQTLKCWHPDILEFIECKTREEGKAQSLIRQGYEANFNGEAYSSVMFQNANLSVRCSDSFLRAALNNQEWTTRAVTTGRPMQTYKAKMLLDKIAEGTWLCGDPGMQYEDTIQRWHTCPNTAPINSSNPCVTGETLIGTAEGYRRIADLVGQETILVDRLGVRRPVSEIFPTGRKPVFRLSTRSGYQLRLTADHKVFTVNRGDVPASELTKDDRIALNPVGFGTDELDPEVAEIVGLMVGDGCISRSIIDGEPISMLTMGSDLEGSIVAEVRDRLNRLKGRSGDGRMRCSVEVGQGGLATTARLSTGSRAVAEVFEHYAVLDRGSTAKRLTDAVFNLSRPALAALLRGLFTADGCVYNYGEKSQSVSLDSVSLDLLRQVQLLLLGFGIKSKLYMNRRVGPLVSVLPNGKGGAKEYPVQQMHSLRISRSSRVQFEKGIGFWPGSHKQAKLELLNQTVATYADRMDDPVASLVYEGEEDVYDLTEPVTHHFGANGLVIHNCSEYMFIDDSACNLSSLNLMKFVREDGTFDAALFRAAVRIFITAQEILVDHASYPTDKIALNSHKFRPLGLGYANLGSLLMASGLPYDSDAGRSLAAAITAIMHGQAYLTSAEHAARLGSFEGFAINREPMLKVMEMHRNAALAIDASAPQELRSAAGAVWAECLDAGRRHGYRNSQVTVLAPTGTIAFMMDCDTTGIEPDIALVKYKQLAGGGMLKIVNRTVPMALSRLGYDEPTIRGILDHIDKHDTIEGAPGLRDEDLPVFDCAFAPPQGGRSIHFRGHLKMMAAVQPFLSGAISKTCNVPNDATVEDIRDAYLEGWKLGLKALAIYRDGSKGSQPVSTKAESGEKEAAAPPPPPA